MIDTNSFIKDCHAETERRKSRLSKIRQKETGIERRGQSNMGSAERDETNSSSPASAPRSKGIMIVRTIQDSVAPTPEIERVIKLQRKRRLLKRHLNEVIKDISDDGNLSPQLSFSDETSNASSTLSSVLYENFNVKFTDVSIRYFPIIPGDNPSTLRGPPISMGWTHESEYTFEFELFEKHRENARRIISAFKMPPHIRAEKLSSVGFSQKEIREATKAAAITRKQRVRTIEMQQTQQLEEAIETVKKTFMKPFKPRMKQMREDKLKSFYSSSGAANTKGSNTPKEQSRNRHQENSTAVQEPTNIMDRTKRTSNYNLFDLDPNAEVVVSNLSKEIILERSDKTPPEDILSDTASMTEEESKPFEAIDVPDLDLDTSMHGKVYELFQSFDLDDGSINGDDDGLEYKDDDEEPPTDNEKGVVHSIFGSILCLPTSGHFIHQIFKDCFTS